MALSAASLATIRTWCGSAVGRPGDLYDADDLQARVARLGTAEAAALEILKAMRADLVLGNPLQFDVDGDHSENSTENLKAIDRQIAQLERIAGAPTVGITHLVRQGDRR